LPMAIGFRNTCDPAGKRRRLRLPKTGAKNPVYTATYVFTNDFAAILPNGEPSVIGGGLSPRLDWRLPEMPEEAIRGVVDA
ncbi:MAG TPA: hypothetical protein VGP68_13605, partial [Gemmataceae bacterium]|nr:hypothetical protein [Gemmataceae bacterium]